MAILKGLLVFLPVFMVVPMIIGRFQRNDLLLGTVLIVAIVLWVLVAGWWVLRKPKPKHQRYKVQGRNGEILDSVDPADEDPEVFGYFLQRKWPYACRPVQFADNKLWNVLTVQNTDQGAFVRQNLTARDFEMIGRARALHYVEFDIDAPNDEAIQLMTRAPQLRGFTAQMQLATNAGVLALAKCPKLEQLGLTYLEHLSEQALQELLKLPRLRHVHLSQTSFTGACFEAVRNSPALQSIRLYEPRGLTARVIKPLLTLPNLEALRIESSKASYSLTAADLTPLLQKQLPKELKLDGRLIDDHNWQLMITGGWLYGPHGQADYNTGARPRNASEVDLISLNRTLVTDAGFALTADCINAKVLNFDESLITDVTMKRLSQFKKLRTLCLEGTKITARGLLAVVDCPVDFMRLDKTELTEDCFKILGRMRTLSEIHLDEVKMRGAWAKHLGQIPNLKILMIMGQQLNSEDIEAIATLRNVKELSLQRTNLDNAGFAKIFSMPQLESLSVDKTQVSQSLCEKARAKRPNLRIFSG